MAKEVQATQLEKVDVVTRVPVDFWHTGVGILIKRVVLSVVANAGLVLYNGLVAESIDWSKVRYAAATTALYIIISTVQTYQDPVIPNTTKDTVIVGKE